MCRPCDNAIKRKYWQTKKGKITCKKYRKTNKGKAAIKISLKRYRSTIRGMLRNTFAHIKERCNDPNHSRYKDYGGRGIKLKFTSDEFVNYVVNVLKIDPRRLEVDRIDNNGNYEPGNIRFVTHKKNCNNKGR